MGTVQCYPKGGEEGQMTSAAATLDQFEARTHDALAGVTRVRRALRDHGQLVVIEAYCYCLFRRFLVALNRPWLRSISLDDAREAARHLSEFHALLAQVMDLADAKGLTHQRIHSSFFRTAGVVKDRVGDVLESLHMCLNEDFRQLIGESIKELSERPGRRDWRSSFAAMRD